jgi:hypothetical protein
MLSLKRDRPAEYATKRLRALLTVLRIDRDENLADMSSKLGIGPAVLSAYETGRKPVPEGLVDAIVAACGLTADEAEDLRQSVPPPGIA